MISYSKQFQTLLSHTSEYVDYDVCSEASTIPDESDDSHESQFEADTSNTIPVAHLSSTLKHLTNTNEDCKVGFELIDKINKIYGVVAYIVGGVPRDIVLGTPEKLNDVDIAVFGMTTDMLQVWMGANDYEFTEVHSTFTLKSYNVEISIANKLLVSSPFTHCDAKTINENILSRDCSINSMFLDLRGDCPKIYDTLGGQIIEDLANLRISTRMTNLRTVFRFRPTFFFRLVKLMIRLSLRYDKTYTIDKIIWDKMRDIKTQNPVTLSVGWSHKFNLSLTDDEFIQFMKVIRGHLYLLKFIRGNIYKIWIARLVRLESQPIPTFNDIEFPALGK